MRKIFEMMIIDNEFNLGQTVYLKTDIDQRARLITSIRVHVDGSVMHNMVCGTNDSTHYAVEISAERNVLIATTE